jgi:biofilm PGA synthesis N-glycosyltransferase PgaC
MTHDFFFNYAFVYPVYMAWMWIIGGLWYYLRLENRYHLGVDFPPQASSQPPVSILIPCFDEEQHIHATLHYALATDYPDFEIIAINDGSKDRTAEMLDEMVERYPKLRVVHLASNQGKAIALNTGAISAKHEFLICIDGDSLLHPNAVSWIMTHFVSGARVGAVTGNPRILTRSTLLGKLQVGEFSSIIGLMKRAQRTYGRIFTVSGVFVGFRRTALHNVGYWSNDMVTEDIDISWRLQMRHWDVRYEPDALCYVYVPETFKGLWKQRLRWAQGGVEVIIRHGLGLLSWRRRRFWGVALEYIASVIWAYIMFFIILLYLFGLVFPIPPGWRVDTLLPQWHGAIIGVTSLVQFGVSLLIDRRYEPKKRFFRNYFWIIWYPLAFWLIAMLTTVVAVPKTLLKRRGKRARWSSPDRGILDPSQMGGAKNGGKSS